MKNGPVQNLVNKIRILLGVRPSQPEDIQAIVHEAVVEMNQLDGEPFLSKLAKESDPLEQEKMQRKWEDRIKKQELVQFGHPL